MKSEKYHFVGIGGIGMSGLAKILLQQNYQVSGSDLQHGYMVEKLQGLGAQIYIGHDEKYVPKEASLIVSSMIVENNPEIIHAKKQNLPILHRSDLLHILMKGKKPLLVAGTHGKTTTSSLLSHVLQHLDSSYSVGGVLCNTETNAYNGKGEFFIAEADESDGTFTKYEPYGAIITNIDNDHMDFYKDEQNLLNYFKTFLEKVRVPELLFYCGDNEYLNSIAQKGISYGFSNHCQLKGSHFRQHSRKIIFDVEFKQQHYKNIVIDLLGFHNALNALAVFGMALSIGVEEMVIRNAFRNFKGVKRRAEVKGEYSKMVILDDYAHHPTEIETTLKGIKNAFPNRNVIVLFQPHRFSRTLHCLPQFGTCFDSADKVYITDLYASCEKEIQGISSQSILEVVNKNSNVEIEYLSSQNLIENVAELLKPYDVLVTMGAGDVTFMGSQILEAIKKKSIKMKLGICFGGQSGEHEISLLSAKNIDRGLNISVFEKKYFYISKKGYWDSGKTAEHILNNGNPEILNENKNIFDELKSCHCIFPMLHGPYGEDGRIQGMFDILNIPYVGCDYQSSAVCMDKAVTKKLAESKGIKVTPYVDISYYEWRHNQNEIIQNIIKKLHFPLFVKPVHLGSTLGVKKVHNLNELLQGIKKIFELDNALLVENAIMGREIEFSVFGLDPIIVYPPGEILAHGTIYDFEAKYSKNAYKTNPCAELSIDEIEFGMDFAKKAYLSCGCDSYARVDCFLTSEGEYILNEINPIPGFTENSLFPKICEVNGMDLEALIDELIAWSFERHRRRSKMKMA